MDHARAPQDRSHCIACPLLRQGLVMYDALYAWCKSLQHETHRWPPAGFSLAS